jgi:oxygen-dependent protoporphyrinogen oxidase
MRFDVAVVGGGVSGLAAAHHLHRSGLAVVLIEATSRLGGKVQTDHQDGFLIEAGPDSFVASKGSVLDLARDLGIEHRVIASRPEYRGSHVWWRGRLHPLPGGLLLMVPYRLGPLLSSSLLSWRGKLRVLADLAIPKGGSADESLESFVNRRLGREVMERIAEPLIAGIHAAEPSTMSLLASFPRFLEMEREHRSLILAARAATSRQTTNGLGHFASFHGGMGQLTDALAGSIAGAAIRTSTTVTALEGGDDGYRLALSNRSELKADGVVLATPASATAKLLSGMAPDAAAAVADIHQVASSTVTLAYRAEHIPPLSGSGFVVPAVENRRIMGVSYLSQKWDGRVPDSRFVLLRAFVGGSKGQELARAEQDHLESAVRHELDALVGITADPVRSWVRAWDEGLHQYTLGHRDRVVRAESALARHPGLALAGAAFHGIGLNECVDSGRNAAETVLTARSGSVSSRPTVRLSSPGGRD